MKNNFSVFKVILVFFSFFPFFTFSQVQDVGQNIYTLFDNTVGLDNIGINNGLEYREKFKTRDNSYAYFDSSDFLIGSIEYNGELYFNINIKYNLYDQEVIVKLKNKNSSGAIVKLYNSKIGSFTINKRKFINLSLKDNDVYEFFEEAFSYPNFLFLIKHQKVKKDLYFEGQMYVEYVTPKKEYFILSNNSYSELDSKKDITGLFPDLKQKINQFYRDNKSLRKTNYDQFLIKLLQELKLAKLK